MTERRVRVIAKLSDADRKRTGLHPRVVLPVEDFEAPEGSVWVKCPEVEVKKNGIFTMHSDGYTILSAGEFEEISN